MSGLALVTGGGGFLGRHVCEVLTAKGWRVRALDLRYDLRPEADAARGSVTDRSTVFAAMEGVDAVVHAAAIADLWTADARDYDRVNVEGTRLVAEAARASGARMVHVSSYTTLVSGPNAPERTLSEGAEIAPEDLLGPYPRSKRRAELAVLDAVGQGLAASIVLPSSPVGPGDKRMTPPTKMIRDFARGGLPAYLECLINLVDARSVAEGIVAAIEAGKPGRRYLLSGEDHPLGDVAAMIAARAGVKAPSAKAPYPVAWTAAAVETGLARFLRRPPTAPLTGVRLAGRRVRFSNERARKELGFAPPPLDVSLDAALAWMAEEGLIPQLAG